MGKRVERHASVSNGKERGAMQRDDARWKTDKGFTRVSSLWVVSACEEAASFLVREKSLSLYTLFGSLVIAIYASDVYASMSNSRKERSVKRLAARKEKPMEDFAQLGDDPVHAIPTFQRKLFFALKEVSFPSSAPAGNRRGQEVRHGVTPRGIATFRHNVPTNVQFRCEQIKKFK